MESAGPLFEFRVDETEHEKWQLKYLTRFEDLMNVYVCAVHLFYCFNENIRGNN